MASDPKLERTIDVVLADLRAQEVEHEELKAKKQEADRAENSASCRLSNLRIEFTKAVIAKGMLDRSQVENLSRQWARDSVTAG